MINLLQQLNGLRAMSSLPAYFPQFSLRNVDPRAALTAVITGAIGYGPASFFWAQDSHYINTMLVTLAACLTFALALNRAAFGRKAIPSFVDFQSA